MRPLFRALLATAVTALPTAALADKPSTTRIETRPFYGATVTLEEGVRVFRPLPPHDRVIINPGGRTPLNLSFEETRSYNYSYGHESRAPAGGDQAGYLPGFPTGGLVEPTAPAMAAKRNIQPRQPHGHVKGGPKY